jgi:hypothetical protein
LRCLPRSLPTPPSHQRGWGGASLCRPAEYAGSPALPPYPSQGHRQQHRISLSLSSRSLPPLSTSTTQQRSALAAQPAADAAARAGSATHSNADEYARFAADPARKHVTWPKLLNASLAEVDPVLVDIIEKEKNRQWKVGREKRRERG